MLLKEKVAIVTGGSFGVGRGIVSSLVQEGAHVVVADLIKFSDEQLLSYEKENRLIFHKTDISKEEEIKALIQLAVQQFNQLDIIVNNAKPKLELLTFEESFKDYDIAMDVMVKAPALFAKHAKQYLSASNSGNIINISSSNAHFISHQPFTYHIAKAALEQLTKFLAKEMAPFNIRVNSIVPSLIHIDERINNVSKENRLLVEELVPLNRAARVDEIGNFVAVLCSKYSSYVTGENIMFDGGVTLRDHFDVAKKVYHLKNLEEK